jgi:KTSC domain
MRLRYHALITDAAGSVIPFRYCRKTAQTGIRFLAVKRLDEHRVFAIFCKQRRSFMIPGQTVKWVPVDADQFEAVGYALAGRKLYVKFRGSPALCYEGVPGFRYQGLLSAPRKDAYFKSFIKSSFLAKEVEQSPQA